MSETAPQLPTDIEVLQARLATALAERDTAIVERDQALSQNERLRHLLHQLQRAQFGRRSEKLDPDQLNLTFEDIEQAIAATEADDDKKDPAILSATNFLRFWGHLKRSAAVIQDVERLRAYTSCIYRTKIREVLWPPRFC